MNRGEASSNSIFITPPDQIQRDPLQSLLNQLSQDEDFPVEHLTDLYYRPVQRPVRNFNMNRQFSILFDLYLSAIIHILIIKIFNCLIFYYILLLLLLLLLFYNYFIIIIKSLVSMIPEL